MKLHVAYDESGRIVAASALIDEKSPRIQPRTGERAAEFDVAPKFAEKDLGEFVPLLRVDVSTNKLVEGR